MYLSQVFSLPILTTFSLWPIFICFYFTFFNSYRLALSSEEISRIFLYFVSTIRRTSILSIILVSLANTFTWSLFNYSLYYFFTSSSSHYFQIVSFSVLTPVTNLAFSATILACCFYVTFLRWTQSCYFSLWCYCILLC